MCSHPSYGRSWQVFLFLGIAFFPFVLGVFSTKKDFSIHDQRKLAEFPPLTANRTDIWSFPSRFNKYLNDHIGLRNPMIRVHNYIKVFLFHTSPSKHVALGKDNWLYIQSEKSLEDYRGLDHFTESQMRQWKEVLRARTDWLNSQKIGYLFMVAPDKHTIYPEFLPDYVQKVHPDTRLDQLASYLNTPPAVEWLDLRKVLWEAKTRHLVYYKTDSHWNSIGGFIGYEAILSRMSPWLPGLEILDETSCIEYLTSHTGGGLSLMLHLENEIPETNYPLRQVKSPVSQKIPFEPTPLSSATIATGSDLRAVVFRDSFFTAVEEFFSEHFNPVYYVWKRDETNSSYDHALLKEIIRKNKPHVVVEERVERFMQTVPTPTREEQFDLSPSSLIRWNSDEGWPGLEPHREIELSIAPSGGLLIRSLGGDPAVILPEFPFPPEKPVILRLDVTSPRDTIFQIFYRTSTMPAYVEKQSIRFPVKKGRHEIFAGIPKTQLQGRLRLDTGNTADDYELHSLEIRVNRFGS